MDFFFYQTNT